MNRNQSNEKSVIIDGIEIPIVRYSKKSEAYQTGFVNGYCFANKIDGETVIQEDASVWALLKDGSQIGASDGESLPRVPKQAEIAAIIMADANGFGFWNEDKIRICFDCNEDGEIENVTLYFVDDMPDYCQVIKTFAELA